jgi:hypothetical protein
MDLRRMVMKPGVNVIAGVVATGLWCCLGCSGPTATSSSSSPESSTVGANSHSVTTEQRLWNIAERAAESMGGSVKDAQAVESRHEAAVRVTSGDIVTDNQQVWTIQVEGFHPFVCRLCSRPPGVAPQRGRFITVIVDAKSFATTDDGLGPTRVDLAQLGTVIDLTGESPSS